MRRRVFLKSAGDVTLVVVGSALWRVHNRGVLSVGEGPAFEPWKDWQSTQNTPLALVRAAILAASPHNTQPWLFKVSATSIDLYIDTKRTPGDLDPYLREEHIGMGCALENLMLAASANGYAATAALLPGKLMPAPVHSGPDLIAQVVLSASPKRSNDLYDAIPRRHTNRNPYEPLPLPTAFVDEISHMADSEPDVSIHVFTANAERHRIAQLILRANDVVYADPSVERGSQRWLRPEWTDVQKYRDGLITDEFGQSPWTTAALKAMPDSWRRYSFKHQLLRTTSYADFLRTVPLFGIIAVRDRYDREQCIAAGRIWQRIHLLTTVRAFAGRPANELVELVDHEELRKQVPTAIADLASVIGDREWQPTFVFCLGNPIRQASPSPRRPLTEVLI